MWRVRSLLSRPPSTARAARTVEAIRYLLFTGSILAFVLPGVALKLAALAVMGFLAYWTVLARRASKDAPSYRCGQRALGLAHMGGMALCAYAGPLIAGLAEHWATRAAVLIVIAGGVALILTDHDCEFSKICFRKRAWDDDPVL